MARRIRTAVLIATAVLSGGAAPAAATYPGANGFIAVSADEQEYGEYRGSAVWAIHRDGSGYRRLTEPCIECGFTAPAWSGDGATMVAARVECTSRDEAGDPESACWSFSTTGAWTLSPRGSTTMRLFGFEPSIPEAVALQPSPNGSRLVYDTGGGRPQVWAINRGGSQNTYLAEGDHARFSPDGKTIAYVGHLERRGLWLMNADGTNQRRIVKDSVRSLDWAPDGRSLVYAESTVVYPRNLFVVSAQGRQRRQITQSENVTDHWPTVSPDGRYVAFVRYKRVGGQSISTQLRYAPLKAGRSKLIREFANVYLEDETGPDLYPAWRPRP